MNKNNTIILTNDLKKKRFWLEVIPENNFIIILIFALSSLKRNLCLMHLKYNARYAYIFTNKRGKKD